MSTISRIAMALLAIVNLFIITSCTRHADYTITRKQVLDLHDKVMAESGRAESEEMQFNTLIKSGLKKIMLNKPGLDTVAAKFQIILLNKTLIAADDQMENWMHTYNNDYKGKTDQETLNYFNTEKFKVAKLDSLYQTTLKSSGDYLKQLNIKPASSMTSGMKM